MSSPFVRVSEPSWGAGKPGGVSVEQAVIAGGPDFRNRAGMIPRRLRARPPLPDVPQKADVADEAVALTARAAAHAALDDSRRVLI
jgi:hypothetical protein